MAVYNNYNVLPGKTEYKEYGIETKLQPDFICEENK